MGNKFIPLGVLISVLVLLFITKPLLQDIREKNITYQAKTQDVKKMNETIGELERLKGVLAGATEQIKRLKLAMPASQQLPEAIVMIEALAKESAFHIESFGVSEAASGNEVGASMSGYGTYSSLYNFTEMLENNIRPLKIKSMSISRGKGNGSIVNVSVGLGLLFQGAYNQQVAP